MKIIINKEVLKMEYNEVLESIIMRHTHKFIYGSKESRESYFKKLDETYKFSSDTCMPVGVYINDSGLEICRNELCDKENVEFFNSRYFEINVMYHIIDKLIKELSKSKIQSLQEDILRPFNYCAKPRFATLEELRNELLKVKKSYIEEYNCYLKTGITTDFIDNLRIFIILLEQVLRNLKNIVPNIDYISLFLDKNDSYSIIYTQIINFYIGARSNGIFNINVICDSPNDWPTLIDINGNIIQRSHDFESIDMNKYALIRKK